LFASASARADEKEKVMPIKPGKDEKEDAWMARCVPEMMGQNGGTKRPQEQAVAACLTMWRDKDKKAIKQDFSEMTDPPDDDESMNDFMERCTNDLTEAGVDDGAAEDACELMWSDKSARAVRHKTHVAAVDGREFILSDNSVDRMGDTIASDGWLLDSFNKNPIALFNHNSGFPIGLWRDLKPKGHELRAHLDLAPEGTSDRIDEIRRLVDAKILKAVSVGFRPIESRARKNETGHYVGEDFLRQELVECSLVSVPANANALAVAKSLKISPATLDLVFAGHGKQSQIIQRSGLTGGHADPRRQSARSGQMSLTLSERIVTASQNLAALKDKLIEHYTTIDDDNVTDEQMTITNELTAKIAHDQKALDALKAAEAHLATTVVTGTESRAIVSSSGNGGYTSVRPFNLPAAKKANALDYFVRAGALMYLAHRDKSKIEDVLRASPYAEDVPTKVMLEYNAKAATAPAMTTVTGWAAELVQQIYTDLMPLLTPKTIYPRLASHGLSLSFGRAGKIIIPTRSLTPAVAGSFVGEGLPIPVRQAAFTSQTLVPKKMAVISVWTKELDEHSLPAIEGVLRDAIQTDTGISLDVVLLDANPATAVRPAGIMNTVTPLTPTAGGGFTALLGDIKQVSGQLLGVTKGNLRAPCWIMNPQQVNSIALTANALGAFPFKDEVSAGTLYGWPIIDSGSVTLGTVIAIDAADFVAVGGEGARFELSDQATLHFEDTAPGDIVGGASGPIPSFPVKSMFQTDSIAMRLILPINWTIRRPGVVSAVTGVTW
jgi:HK97 family phage major capsid protein/HK97 family phage prohead protease